MGILYGWLGDSLVFYPCCVTTFRHVIVVMFETMLKVAKRITTWINESQLEYFVQEPSEACVGDGGPLIMVHIDVGYINGCR